MKYRVELNTVFNNTDANSLLNYIESIKTKIFNQIGTQVPIVRKAYKGNYEEDALIQENQYASIDFDSSQYNHIDSPGGITDFHIIIDISFTVQQDYYDFLNYVETIKSNALNTGPIVYIRNCRYYICRHEEIPLIKDGVYSYIDFDGSQLIHPV